MDKETTMDDFRDIRPLLDEEVPSTIESLISLPLFEQVIRYVHPKVNWNEFVSLLRSCRTISDFKTKISYGMVMAIADKTTFSLSISGRSRLPKEYQACTFISNHRDIVLDASFLNVLLYDIDYKMAQVAIGDNLLVYPWIETLARLNNSFIVKRKVNIKQMLIESKKLSSYIHYAIQEEKESVWIAQREGRAKDSNDRTQISLLKMLNMGGKEDIIDNLVALNIVPVSLTYEYDPCDYLKAKEFQLKRDSQDYVKSPQEDILNMQTGIEGNKGRVHFTIGTPIKDELLKLKDAPLNKAQLFEKIAEIIDKEIFRHYRFYPGNYVAYDLLMETHRFSEHYSEKEKNHFEDYLNQQLAKINIPQKDESFLKKKILEMYANPLINNLQVR